MRETLGNQDSSFWIAQELGVPSRAKYEQIILARYCANCGAELIGIVIFAEETYSFSELQDLDREYRKERSLAFKKAFEYSGKMREAVFGCKSCPICGQTFPERALPGFCYIKNDFRLPTGMYYYCWDSIYDAIFDKMKTIRKNTYLAEAKELVAKLTEKANEKYQRSDLLVPKTVEISASVQTLLLHIGHLMRLEVGLYDIEQNLAELYKGKSELRAALLKEKDEQISSAFFELRKVKAKMTDFVENHNSFVSVPFPEINYPVRPEKPRKPHFNDNPPVEPIYKTAGLFNKKKIMAENEVMKNAYEKELERYNQRKAAYQLDLASYEKNLAQYMTENAAWTAEVEALKKKAQSEQQTMVEQKEIEYNEKVSEYKRDVQKAEVELKLVIDKTNDSAGLIYFSEEISEGEKLLESIIATRNELYGYNVIYPKYRNIIALSSFYDYLMSGRCNSLAGADGAYNLYESESRADLIITKLSDVLASLDKIQENQYILYQQMSDVNNGIKSLNESMTSAISSLAHLEATGDEMKYYLKAIKSDTSDVSSKAKAIAENTEVTAHYSKISAHYAKRNAELTDALGYMVAFK